VDEERPMLSALALTPDAEDDGLLTTAEVFRVPVPADLVVLSACDTARGKVYRGEGMVGFTRAFFFAGTPRVIVSLWRVDDEATRALMTRFYARWKAGASTAAALREAQELVRSTPRWKHPHYWAAWVLWGLAD
jgi:CHAT domain-containing protein